MLKAIETDNVIKNIIREILRECSVQGVRASETLASFLIRLLVSNPDHGFITDKEKPLQREDVERLVMLCVHKLSERNSPSLATIKMQVYFDTNFPPRDVLLTENRDGITQRVWPLIKEIVETSSQNKEELDKLYRKMIVAIILLSGLGNPTIHAVLREATVALQSVFPPSELGQFMALSRREKEQQMTELTQIVTGIRLFNRDCQKGGEGIEDIPHILQQALVATRETLHSNLKKLMGRTDILTAAVETILKMMVSATATDSQENPDTKETKGSDEEEVKVTDTHKQIIKSALATARQLEVFIRKMLSAVHHSHEVVKDLLERLQIRLLKIHDTVRFRTAIPTVQVYPQFIDLAEIWTSLQEEMVLLSIVNNISWSLQNYSSVLDYIPQPVLKSLVDDEAVATDAERLEATTGYVIVPTKEMECEIIEPHQVAGFDDISLQYLGFCVWSLVHGQGALIPANPNMGVCRWKGKFYAFSSIERGEQFGCKPGWYVGKALNVVRRQPDLIELLQLQEEVDAVKVQGDEYFKETEPLISCDSEAQTELHPIPSNMDPEYTWDVWDLKRRALALANISKCKTHSTQTIRSNFRKSVYIQAAPDKDKGTQTRCDVGTNVPTLINYIYGLRGRTDDKQRVITLTRPVYH